MTGKQINDSEGNQPYFVMQSRISGQTTWDVYRRGQGTAVKVGFSTRSGAWKWAEKMNRKAAR